jgi:hypothetical protein
MKNNLTERILRLVATTRFGMGATQIYEKIDHCDKNTVRVIICAIAKRGYLIKDNKDECETCHHPYRLYRISQEGKEYLAKRKA